MIEVILLIWVSILTILVGFILYFVKNLDDIIDKIALCFFIALQEIFTLKNGEPSSKLKELQNKYEDLIRKKNNG